MSDGRTIRSRTSGIPVRTLSVKVVRGPDAGRTFVAESDTISIGTGPGNDLVLTDETVSRYHLELRRQDDRILVQDHRSTNGTSVGGALIERGTIGPGTVVGLGHTTLQVTDGERINLEMLDGEKFGGLVGREPLMRHLMATVQRASQRDISILLLGETGTGKEVIAHAIHDASPRAKKPFETVDCGALLPTLIASELFGHERGAFTGADRQQIGAFERADGGTLFLDEIGELPISVQSALLGALERRSFRRLGGQKHIEIDVRVISATHRDIRAEVNTGTFRQDLYYRIAALLIRVPTLRDRPGDIPLLIDHFLAESGYTGTAEELIPQSSMAVLKAHHWPGNVRELRNFVDAAIAMGSPEALPMPGAPPPQSSRLHASGDDGADTGDLPPSESDGPAPRMMPAARDAKGAILPYGDARNAVIKQFEKDYLENIMEVSGGNVSKAARVARMDRSYLMQMLKRHGIQPKRSG